MAKEFAKPFYNSDQWQSTRELYMKSVDGLCENCLAKGIYRPGKIVHHIVHLTEDNVENPMVSLNPANLRCLCQDCHAEEHASGPKLRYIVDAEGNIIPKETRI